MEYQFELRKEADLPPIRPTIRDEVREFYKSVVAPADSDKSVDKY